MRSGFRHIARYVYAAAACVYLFTFGLFSRRHRDLAQAIFRHFRYGGKKPIEAIVPKVPFSGIAPDDTLVRMHEPTVIEGNVSVLELLAVNRLMRVHQPRRVFEIGTFDGRTTLNIASNCGTDAEVFTLDLPKSQIKKAKLPLDDLARKLTDKETSGLRFRGTPYGRQIHQLYGDSATFEFRPYHNTIDAVFVDGAHSYEYVKNDTEQALNLLRNGRGMILWHDYAGAPGVTRALNELYASGGAFADMRHIEGTALVLLVAGAT